MSTPPPQGQDSPYSSWQGQSQYGPVPGHEQETANQQQGYSPPPGYVPPPPPNSPYPGYPPPTPGPYSQPLYPAGYAAPIPYAVPVGVVVPQIADPGSGLATTSLIMGILGLVTLLFVWVPVCGAILPIVLGVLGIIFGAIGRKSVTRHGQAIAGLVMSIITVAIPVGYLVVILILFLAAGSSAAGAAS